jgi:hypothetical protein
MNLPIFIQISDLHLSQTSEEDRRRRKLFWERWRFEGMLGHSENSLRYLDDFVYSLRQEEPEAQLIVTGDLTAIGQEEEFEIANKFIGATYQPPRGGEVGLNVGNWQQRAIPGNHDHWPGHATIVGRPTDGLRKYFPAPPRLQPVVQLGNGRQLRLLLIDTDRDVGPYSHERVRAVGSFVSELEELSAMLSPLGMNENEIRVLCLHHSAIYRGWKLEIDARSRKELYEFLLRHRVAVALCGHIHRPPWVQTFPVTRPMAPGRTVVVEACCGTTTQFDPTIAREAGFEDSLHWQNSLFVHRLSEVRGEIHWSSEIYLEGRAGFVRADRLRSDIDARAVFKVWPWPPQGIRPPFGIFPK